MKWFLILWGGIEQLHKHGKDAQSSGLNHDKFLRFGETTFKKGIKRRHHAFKIKLLNYTRRIK